MNTSLDKQFPKRGRLYWMRGAEAARAKIAASKLIERLQQFATNEKGDNGEVVVMTNAQVRAALGLLAKVIPDLTESDIHHHQVEPESPIAMVTRLRAMLGDEQANAILERIGFRYEAKQATDVEVISHGNGRVSGSDPAGSGSDASELVEP